MSADAITNPPPSESKTARKKREKAEAEAAAKAGQTTAASSTPVEEQSEHLSNGSTALAPSDSPFIKELQKQIRNVTKKLNLMSRLDAILAENEGVSLDDLVASRKINNDQREQALRKPGLQATLAQLEDQITQYKKVDADYQSRMNTQHASLAASHKSEIEALKAQLQKEAEEKSKTELRKKLLTFSQFLRAAAAKRVIEEEADTEESKGFEGVLLLVYGGDEKAVDAAEKLIEGADDAVPSVEGQLLSVKYSQIKSASLSYGPFPDEETAPVESTTEAQVDSVEPEPTVPSSDPTIAHAGLTELGLNQTNGTPAVAEQFDEGAAKEATVDDASANLAAQQQWDNSKNATGGGALAEDSLDESFEMVARDPSETEAVHDPALPQSTNSWADDATAAAQTNAPANATPTNGDDGFHEVERKGGRGGHRGHGEGRGRGGRGRGGFRGDGRGRGRGGFRGDGQRGHGRGGPRGGSETAPAPARS
ncbi:hypothetical protein AAFC00_005171 [Neodothiora populina]|uniref:YAG7-like dimerisation domain-containing protein n=1 Tax=Neodothiora populina TaxID=2781224 RepID=A0ABR3PL68_9PEZI